ncbi:DUF1801 domain-containing protein [Fructilactobacillus myrtifloralis]|uniref:DUF1801 domain-containing protein n=1 Tax=Fructilactobacillus myrtifloralis TaxID=2940301 RepID=A0ABY5BPT1_9LACO|nr:DUF1801 domain-containing protein [Fructilactobacillus myrtifloralis]USS85565.1 DUF1801 domain-containing protein [Fructilactobacillus myrtifloralis]
MKTIPEYLKTIADPAHRASFQAVLRWITTNFPQLDLVIKYNQPMFLAHGTYIIGLSAANHHYSIGLEGQAITRRFLPLAEQLGLQHGHKTIRVPYKHPLPTELLQAIITRQLEQKRDVTTFWLPAKERFQTGSDYSSV